MKKYVMKNRVFAVIVSIAIAAIAMSYITGARSSAADVESELLTCFFQGRSYADLSGSEKERVDELMRSDYARMWDESIGSMTSTYHENINKKFNEYVKKSMTSAEAAALDPNSPEAVNSRAPDTNTTEEALKKCSENDYANYSTYCASVTLYADPRVGYKGFRDVMSCRKYDIFESTKERNAYIDAMVMGTENENKAQIINQQQMALRVANNVDEASRAVADAKAALDQTLSAYDQMKLAWSMHVRYMKIYEDLLKYRDKLVDMRHYVESFPAKFIDASTTQCT